ncbi:MAG TPA: ATP-binding protein [Bacteroidaceae bacterium]|nr:ATP-binding protein [Bacteroidaceae bacterium]
MYLRKFTFRENAGQKIEWLIDNVTLGMINLVVGKNSSGKTRTLNAITDLMNMIRGREALIKGIVSYDVTFLNNQSELRYILEFDEETISVEKLYLKDEMVLERGPGGKGRIKYQSTPGSIFLDFEIPHDQLACYAKRDKLQHPFIEYIHDWAANLRRFDFSGELGKNSYELKTVFEEREIDFNKTNASLVPFLYLGMERFEGYKDAVLEDMHDIGYDLEDLGIIHYSDRYSITKQDRYAIYTTEQGLEKKVTQRDMSQGMFRAFSVLVQLNYYIMSGFKGCVIIDDIGEGLDFNRAKQLVNLLVSKAEDSGIQMILSTNDSFIMNAVDIKNWAVLNREGNKINLYNYENSKEIFEDFKFTGLNNFDFYASEFFKSGFSDEDIEE